MININTYLRKIEDIKIKAEEFYKDYNTQIDQELFAAMLEMYYYNVRKNQHPPIFKKIENQLLGMKSLDFEYFAKRPRYDVFVLNKVKNWPKGPYNSPKSAKSVSSTTKRSTNSIGSSSISGISNRSICVCFCPLF